MFDLPTNTKVERKKASNFRNSMILDGFQMFQFSAYIRHCSSRENAEVHIKRVKSILPDKGLVCIHTITDKQFGMMEIYYGRQKPAPKTNPEQLTLF